MARESYVLKMNRAGEHELVLRADLSAWLAQNTVEKRSAALKPNRRVERGSWVWRDGRLLQKSAQIIQLRKGSGLQIIKDIEPYRNVAIDNKVVGGRKQHRDMLRAHGCVEVGNEKHGLKKWDEKAHDRSVDQTMRRIINGV